MELEHLQKSENTEEKKSKPKNSDFITDVIGIFGLFHAVTYTIMGLSLSIHCWQMMVNKFYTYKTDFWCARPDSHRHLSVEEWRNISAPRILEEYDQCFVYDVDYNSTWLRPHENTTTKPCISWEYDTEYFDVRNYVILTARFPRRSLKFENCCSCCCYYSGTFTLLRHFATRWRWDFSDSCYIFVNSRSYLRIL